MKKNVANQIIGVQMITAADGTAFTGAVTVYVTGDGGAQAVGSVGSGACTSEDNGFHTYGPAQGETDYDHIGFTFIGTGAIPCTIQVYPTFPQTGDSFARIGAAGASLTGITGAQLAADQAVNATKFGGATVNATTSVTFPSTSTVATTTGAVGLVTNAVTLPTIPTNWITADGLAADAGTELGTATWATATRTLTASTNLNDLDAAGVATAVWNAATATYGGAGTYGQAIEDTLADTADIQPNYATAAELAKVPKSDSTVSWNATALSAIQTQASSALTSYDPPTKAELDSGFTALNDLDAGATATAVWNAATVTYGGAGTYGQAVEDTLADTNELQTDDIPGLIGTVQADLDTITGSDGVTLATAQALYAPAKAGDNMGTVSSVTGAVGSVAGNVDGDVTGSVGSNLELGPAEVNAEVVDVLKTDTMTQSTLCPQEAPPVNATLEEAIAYLYKAWRNKSTQTATTYSLFADDGTTVDQKTTVSDNSTTATKGEIITGP